VAHFFQHIPNWSILLGFNVFMRSIKSKEKSRHLERLKQLIFKKKYQTKQSFVFKSLSQPI